MATEWTLSDAVAEFPKLSQAAENWGYRLSLFGSVLLKGHGRDLDLLATPIGNTEKSHVQFLGHFGGVLKSTSLDQAKNICSVQVEREGRIYHFVFGGFWKMRG